MWNMPTYLGIPFDFTAKPVVVNPGKPRETTQIQAVRPERDNLEITFPRVTGYREDPPKEDLVAAFTEDSKLELTPDLIGPTRTRNEGIIGEGVDLTLVHTGDLRISSLVYHLTKRLLETKWRDPNEDLKLYLFGKLKTVVKQWLDTCLDCRGGTYPAQLMYQSLADEACNRITAAIRSSRGERSVKALLDSYNPLGSTRHVNFNTSKSKLWPTDSRKSHINYVVLDSHWEAEFCQVAESHIRVSSPMPRTTTSALKCPTSSVPHLRTYIPDFVLHIDDGREDHIEPHRGDQGLQGRGRQAKEKHHGLLLGTRCQRLG